jgi:hypothetical protein
MQAVLDAGQDNQCAFVCPPYEVIYEYLRVQNFAPDQYPAAPSCICSISTLTKALRTAPTACACTSSTIVQALEQDLINCIIAERTA